MTAPTLDAPAAEFALPDAHLAHLRERTRAVYDALTRQPV